MAEERPLCEAFLKITELALALGVEKINELPHLWFHEIDDHWSIAVNGHDADRHFVGDPTMMSIDVPRFSAAIWWNGWLAGIVDPYAGVIADGAEANEDTFVAALDNAIVKAGSVPEVRDG